MRAQHFASGGSAAISSSYPQWAYLAMTPDGTVAGYLVGALDEASGFDDFAAAAEQFPAHLHVNLAPHFRNRGIGAELIEAFAADAARAGAKGMHVVTSADARNVRFYERVGFHPARPHDRQRPRAGRSSAAASATRIRPVSGKPLPRTLSLV